MKRDIPSASDSGVSPPAFVKRLAAAVLLINLFVMVLAGFSLWQSRLQYEERAAVTTQNLAHILERYIGGSIDRIDVGLLAAKDQIEEQLAGTGIDRRELTAILARQSSRLPDVDAVRMLDVRGEIAYGKGVASNDRKSAADCDFFLRLRDEPQAGLFISKPLQSRIIGKWVIMIARRVNGPDGSFAGVVYGVVPLERFLRVFSTIDVGIRGSITLRDRDLGVLARYPDTVGIGVNAVSARLRELIGQGKSYGTYKATYPVDRVERMFTYRRISDCPLYVTVGLATADYLGEWRGEVVKMSVVEALFFLITLFMSWLVWKDWKRGKAAVQALVQQEEKFHTIFNNSADAILIRDRAGNIIEANEVACDRLGYSRNELLSKTVHDIDSETNRDKIDEMLKKVFDRGQIVFDRTHLTRDGRKIPTEISARVINFEGRELVLSMCRDVTERKNLETQLNQAQKMEAVGQLAGGIAHDFNNILTAIIGYIEIILMRMDKDDPLRYYVEQTLASADRAAELTAGLLAFSRKQVLHAKPLDLNGVVRGVKNMLSRLIPEDIELKTEYHEKELVCMADKGQIEQVLMNLVTNARDAMPNGGSLTIRVFPAVIDDAFIKTHGFGEPGNFSCVSVTDTGSGMDGEIRRKIFEPFFTTKELGKGTGLGLAIIYGIIKQHNGYVVVDSSHGEGTVFSIYLPLADRKEEERRTLGEEPPVGGTETILFAEDDTNVLEMNRTALEAAGYTVIEAVDGRDAFDKFMKRQGEVDILVTDVIMPRIDGRRLCEKIRRVRPGIKVLFISGYAKEFIDGRGIKAEMENFMSKPVTPSKLLKKLRAILDHE